MAISNRRNFLKSAAIGSAAAGAGMSASALFSDPSGFNRIRYRDLGSTGCKVSEMGFGVLHTQDTALIHGAIDSGITYFDTAHGYQNGACETTLGKVMKTRRKEIFLTTKISGSPEKMREEIDISLRRLQTDCVDMLLVHGPGSREQILDNDTIKVMDDARSQGKTRFVGFSTHNQVVGLDAAIESNFWQSVSVPYNYFSPPEVADAIKRARAKGIAIIAMKALITVERPRKPFPDIRADKNGSTTNQQALLRWVLNDPNVDTVIPGIGSFEHLADDVAVMGTKLTMHDRQIIRRYTGDVKQHYCQGIAGCTGCREMCPYGVEIHELNRCINYAYGYGSVDLARYNYSNLPRSSRIEKCDNCETCVVKCVNGLDMNVSVNRARALFA